MLQPPDHPVDPLLDLLPLTDLSLALGYTKTSFPTVRFNPTSAELRGVIDLLATPLPKQPDTRSGFTTLSTLLVFN